MDGRQTLVAAGDAAFPLFFDVPQEGAQQVRIDVEDEQFVHFLMCHSGSENVSVKIGHSAPRERGAVAVKK
jgi:hypothetical protein